MKNFMFYLSLVLMILMFAYVTHAQTITAVDAQHVNINTAKTVSVSQLQAQCNNMTKVIANQQAQATIICNEAQQAQTAITTAFPVTTTAPAISTTTTTNTNSTS